MDLFGKKLIAQIQSENKALREEVRSLDNVVAATVQELSINQNRGSTNRYDGNLYKEYGAQVVAIDMKYKAEADWGNQQVGSIIDVRSSFIVGDGLTFKTKGDTETALKEMDFARELFKWNNLEFEGLQDLAKEGEIEGKVLLRLFVVDLKEPLKGENGTVFNKMIAVRFVPWQQYKYKITTDPKDYQYYTGVMGKEPVTNADFALTEEQFVYLKFGGRIAEPNHATPKIAKCLTQIEYLDKALRDWREINNLFAAPTPTMECVTPQDAQVMTDKFTKQNWKAGKFLVHVGQFKYASAPMEGIQSLREEITANAKLISGTTGVPVHFLGFPELMSNRATADNLFELITTSTQKERQGWKGLLNELLNKAIDMHNAQVQTPGLQKDLILLDIPFISKQQYDRFVAVYLAAYNVNLITKRTALTFLPGVDADDEMKQFEIEAQDKLDEAKNNPMFAPPVQNQQSPMMPGMMNNGGNNNGQTPQNQNGGNQPNPGNFGNAGNNTGGFPARKGTK